MDLRIKHDKDAKEFFAVIEGQTAKLNYSVSADKKTLDYRSTFVPPQLRGHQVGEKLVKFALDYAKENHYKVIPSCPFVKTIIDRHPEYKELVQ